VYGCLNCHDSPAGGTPRNAFGVTIEENAGIYLDFFGNVVWQASLASIDSDGDGVSNGAELQDPTGAWRIGQPQPGNPALVTNPGYPPEPSNVPAMPPLAAGLLAAALAVLGRVGRKLRH
jgi:hypothetical protein